MISADASGRRIPVVTALIKRVSICRLEYAITGNLDRAVKVPVVPCFGYSCRAGEADYRAQNQLEFHDLSPEKSFQGKTDSGSFGSEAPRSPPDSFSSDPFLPQAMFNRNRARPTKPWFDRVAGYPSFPMGWAGLPARCELAA